MNSRNSHWNEQHVTFATLSHDGIQWGETAEWNIHLENSLLNWNNGRPLFTTLNRKVSRENCARLYAEDAIFFNDHLFRHTFEMDGKKNTTENRISYTMDRFESSLSCVFLLVNVRQVSINSILKAIVVATHVEFSSMLYNKFDSICQRRFQSDQIVSFKS